MNAPEDYHELIWTFRVKSKKDLLEGAPTHAEAPWSEFGFPQGSAVLFLRAEGPSGGSARPWCGAWPPDSTSQDFSSLQTTNTLFNVLGQSHNATLSEAGEHVGKFV